MRQGWGRWARCGWLAVGVLALSVGAADAQVRAWYGVISGTQTNNTSGVRSVDLVTGAPGPKVTLGAQANDIVLSPDGSRVYAARFDATVQDGLRVIDAATSQLVASVPIRFPLGLGISPDGAKVYVAAAGGVNVVATATNTITRVITGLQDARNIAVSADGRWGYVPLGSPDRLAFLDLQTETVITTIPVADYPNTVTLSPDGTRLFVGHVVLPIVSVIDTATRTVLGEITFPSSGAGTVASLATVDGRSLYVSAYSTGTLYVADVATRTNRGPVPLPSGVRVRALEVMAGRRYLAALDPFASTVTVIDGFSGEVVRTTPAGQGAGEFVDGLATTGTLILPPEYRFTFDELRPTAPPQSGALTSVEVRRGPLTMRVSRPGSRFDIVDNTVNGQLGKPSAYGTRSLDPFCCSTTGGPFVLDFNEAVTRVSLDVGDYGDAADPVRLEAFSGPNGTGVKVGEASAQVPAGPANGAQFTSTTVTFSSAQPFRSVRVQGGEAAYPNSVFFDNVVVGWADADQDSLPDTWELLHGLSVGSAAGADGASGDVDGDGVSNAAEFSSGTHPSGTVRQYLAEGATGAFFSTRLALFNPGNTASSAVLTFQRASGGPIAHSVSLPARTRVTVDAAAIPGVGTAEFSVAVESRSPVVVDRTMTWDGSGFGAHAETSLSGPALTWYLAEGSTVSGFNLFYLLQNPNPTTAEVRIRYLRSRGAPLEKTYTLLPQSRTTVWVNQEDFAGLGKALAAEDVSAVIDVQNSQPIIVERAMYRDVGTQTYGAGHASAGITAPATEWFLAEGATGSYFDLFVLIANPSAQTAQIEVTYLLPTGETVTKPHVVAGNSRYNIWVDLDDPRLANTAVSTTVRVSNGVPVIVERAMWWPGDVTTWHEAHNAPGATRTGSRWALAEGEVGGARGVDTYVLIANTSAFATDVTVTLHFEDGASTARTFTVAAQSRFNVDVRAEFPGAVDTRFAAVVESGGATPAALVVERAMYWDAGGQRWAAGTNALGTRVP